VYARIGQIRVVLGNRGKGAVGEDRENGAALCIASEWCCVDGVGRGFGGFDVDLVDTGAIPSCGNGGVEAEGRVVEDGVASYC
jgi:hypothetical protein